MNPAAPRRCPFFFEFPLDFRLKQPPGSALRKRDVGTPFWCNRGGVISPQYSPSAFRIAGSADKDRGRNITQ